MLLKTGSQSKSFPARIAMERLLLVCRVRRQNVDLQLVVGRIVGRAVRADHTGLDDVEVHNLYVLPQSRLPCEDQQVV